ncbi:hypothetical protein [Paraburkholderia bryophila]|uniref:Uncharacterized protein n=1 Tax=Paraburkholderia bryophila TaxID=420952 RepID=A0A7Y9W740_9BURK|nr:hypothetical protein [Paraburkholderia bryophila]NYH15105.1 hypothetical protein [Paraburkholderia bryophila]
MQRTPSAQERQLIEFLIAVNAPLYENDAPRWMAQLRDCTVRAVNIPCCLSISHAEVRYRGWEHSHTLARELIALDEGVPVLIYAIIDDTQAGPVLDSFNIDRLDGKELVVYPAPGERLMIVEGNKWVGEADFRHVYGRRRL